MNRPDQVDCQNLAANSRVLRKSEPGLFFLARLKLISHSNKDSTAKSDSSSVRSQTRSSTSIFEMFKDPTANSVLARIENEINLEDFKRLIHNSSVLNAPSARDLENIFCKFRFVILVLGCLFTIKLLFKARRQCLVIRGRSFT